jgi:hypothetical protein
MPPRKARLLDESGEDSENAVSQQADANIEGSRRHSSLGDNALYYGTSPVPVTLLQDDEELDKNAKPGSPQSADPTIKEISPHSSIVDTTFFDSDEEEGDEEVQKKDWRKSWLAENFLRELPLIGGLFDWRMAKRSDALYSVGKSVCALAVGGVAMALTPLQPEEEERIEVRLAKLVAAMAVGKAVGGMACNTVSSGIITFYRCCQNLQREEDALLEEASHNARKASTHHSSEAVTFVQTHGGLK